MKSWLFSALILALPAWADPFATATLPSDPSITACDYEDTTTGETARLPVVIDMQRGDAPDYRVCKYDIEHWLPGSTHAARARSVNAAGVFSEWVNATLNRPAATSVTAQLIAGEASPSMTITAAGLAGSTGYGGATSGTRSVGSVTAGQLVVVTVGAYQTSPGHVFVASDLTKTAGTSTIGTISVDVSAQNGGTGTAHAAVFSFIVTGSGTLTVTIANLLGGSYFDIGSEAFNGSWDGSRVDGTPSSAQGTATTAVASGNVTTAGAGLIVACFDDVTGASSYTTNGAFTDIYKDTGSPNNSGAAYKIVSTGTTTQGSWTANIPISSMAAAVAYKQAAGGAPATQLLTMISNQSGF